MLMKSLIAAGFLASSALGAQLKLNVEDANQGCSAQQTSEDQANRLKMEVKLQSLGVVCEEMCQRVHAYPKCQCPGFGSMPAEDAAGDERTCFTKNCQVSYTALHFYTICKMWLYLESVVPTSLTFISISKDYVYNNLTRTRRARARTRLSKRAWRKPARRPSCSPGNRCRRVCSRPLMLCQA